MKYGTGHPFPERSKAEKMKPAQSQNGGEVGQVTSQDGKPGVGYIFKFEADVNHSQAAGNKESCK
jgi:hypothetical protein